MNDEMRLIFERLLKTLEVLAERNERLSHNLDRVERTQEADAIRTGRLEEAVAKLTRTVDGLADVVANTQEQIAATHQTITATHERIAATQLQIEATQLHIEALAVAGRNTDARIDRLADVVERFITARGNKGSGGTL